MSVRQVKAGHEISTVRLGPILILGLLFIRQPVMTLNVRLECKPTLQMAT